MGVVILLAVRRRKMEIVYRKLSELKELKGNPRKITRAEMDSLKKSIEDNQDYFEARPIILSNRTGELVIIAGNQRYKAAKELGMDEVPTALLEGLTEEREKEIIIRDNVSNGDWDYDELKNWDADDLEAWGVEIKNDDKDSGGGSGGDDGEPEVEFSEYLDEESNYVILKFNTDIDWLNAQSKLGIKPVKCFSTRKDGVITSKMNRIGVGRVLDGASVLARIKD